MIFEITYDKVIGGKLVCETVHGRSPDKPVLERCVVGGRNARGNLSKAFVCKFPTVDEHKKLLIVE